MSENFTGVAGLPPGRPAGLTPGSRLASYYLEDRIGAGGMAVVYRAYDERLRRPVARKVMSPQAAPDAAFRQRFVLEAQAAAAVDDPHIVLVYEAGEGNGTLFIAMRYVPAGDVHSLVLRGGPLAPPHALAILSGVASALDAAHAAGLVHRDVKPANMLLDVRPGRPDHVYLSDFGLTKGTMATHGFTAAGQFLGTPDYSAPEQMQAKPTYGRADQYSLACAAFELLTGAPPYPREQVTAVIWAHMSEAPPPLSSRVHGLPAAADTVLARALAKAPGDRYETCRAFTDALRAALGLEPYSSGSGSRPPAPPPGVAAWASVPHPGKREQSPANWCSRAAARPTGWRRMLPARAGLPIRADGGCW
ncbi:MAG TPA: serine/threonine-protein kinase [Streptosporangiaceae bacterium]